MGWVSDVVSAVRGYACLCVRQPAM
jgi:hypothetical protein